MESFEVIITGVQLVNQSLGIGAPPGSPSFTFPTLRVIISRNDHPEGLLNIQDGGPVRNIILIIIVKTVTHFLFHVVQYINNLEFL